MSITMSDNTTDNAATAGDAQFSPETVNEEDTSNEDNILQDTIEVDDDNKNVSAKVEVVVNDKDVSDIVVGVQQLPLNIPNNLAALDDADIAAAEYDNEFLSLLPPCIIPRVDKLKSLNDKRDEILEEYRLERAALEMKYAKKMDPLFEERRGVINGEFDDTIGSTADTTQSTTAVDDEEYVDVAEEGVVEDVNEDDENEQQVPQPPGANAVKGIPQFWACALGHVDVIAELITEADIDCLDHLTDITCANFEDGTGFELHFYFSPNKFFTNTTLTKRYEVPNLLTEDEPILKNVTGTTIDWKLGHSLTYREVTKKQRKKGGPNAGQIRTVSKKERTDSLFHWFTPPSMPGLTEVVDEDEADAVEEAFDHDYDIAQAIKNHLIPKAILWFTGEAMMEDYDDEELEEMMMQEEGAGAQPFTFNPNPTGGGDNPFPQPQPGEGENPECKQN